MRTLFAESENFDSELSELRSFDLLESKDLDLKVDKILHDIRLKGDAAVISYVRELERREVRTKSDLRIKPEILESCYKKISEKERSVLSFAIDRIESFHRHQIESSWSYRDELNNLLGQQVAPINRVGVYIPGGKASYPSTALMAVIPACLLYTSDAADE